MEKNKQSLENMRREYTKAILTESDLPDNPKILISSWFDLATQNNIDYNECILATASKNSMPSARVVLLKGREENNFYFYTDSTSKKGKDLAENPQCEILFYFASLDKQIRISGKTKPVDKNTTKKYFDSRSFSSRISAYTSNQSKKIASREFMEKKWEENNAKFCKSKQVPLPERWQGYMLEAKEIEFWQGRENRFHDRILYTKQSVGKWECSRIEP